MIGYVKKLVKVILSLIPSHFAVIFCIKHHPPSPPPQPMHARLTIDGKNLGESIVRMEMILPHAVVSNGWEGGGGF
jgi:hypothetical protein